VELALERRRFVAATFALALAAGLFAAWVGLGVGGHTATLWFDDTATPLAALLGWVLCVRARNRQPAQMRRFWTLLALAMASWTAAELIWGYYALILNVAVPEPSWADIGYLGAIPLAVAALIAHPATHGSGTRTRTARRVFEGLLVATSLLFLSWTLVLGPLWRTTDLSTLGGIVSIAYPFGDVVIVFFVLLAIRGMSGGDRLPLWCLLGGLMAMAVSDSTFTYLADSSSYSSPGLVDTGWVVAYLGIALSAFSAGSGRVRFAAVERTAPSLASLVAPIAPVLIALSVAAVEIRLGDHIGRPAWLMVFALVVLVLTRQGFAVVELLDHGRDGREGLIARITEAALGDGTGVGGPHGGPGAAR
jgi:hypothetical protein